MFFVIIVKGEVFGIGGIDLIVFAGVLMGQKFVPHDQLQFRTGKKSMSVRLR